MMHRKTAVILVAWTALIYAYYYAAMLSGSYIRAILERILQ
jgi:hypothetical protein